MEFDYDLFNDAKSAGKDATLKMIQIKDFVRKAKAIPLPEILNTAGIYALLDQVLTIKDNAFDINSMLDDWSAAIDEAYRIQSEEEYNRLMGEYADVQARIDEFSAYIPAGRVSLEEGLAMNEEAGALHAERDAIDARLTELEAILGVKRPNEYQWWDDLVAVSKDINSDLKDLCGDYGDMFQSIGTDAFSDNFDNVVQGTIDVSEKIDATTAQIGSDITRGVGNLIEKGVDFTIQAGSWLILNTGATGIVFTVADLLGSDIKDTVEDWTKSVVETDVVDYLYNDFYTKTERGQEINDLSYIKYDSTIAGAINEGTQSVVETGVAVALSVLATPAAGAAFIALVKGGEAVNKAYDNGATFNQATGYGAIEAAVNGGMWYVLGKSGEGIKALTSSASMFGRDASLKLLGTYALRNAGTVGAKPFIDALAEKVTYNSETSLGDILEQNNTLNQSLMGMSMAGLMTYVPGYFLIDKATTSLAAVETLGLPATTGAAETTAYTTLYNPEVAVETVGAISAGSPELGLSVISNNGIANLTGGLVTTIPSYIPTSLPAALSGSMEALPKVISNIDGLLEPVGSMVGGIPSTGVETTVEVPVYKDYFKLTSNEGLETTDSPYLKLVTSSDPLTPITIEGAEVVYYDKLTETIKLETHGDLGTISEPITEPIEATPVVEPKYSAEYNDKLETIREEIFNLDETSSPGEFPHYKTDLERVVNSSLELEARIEISGDKIKVYDIDLPASVREEEYLKILHEFTDREISEGVSLDSLISSKTAEYQSRIDALQKIGGELEIEPYYGQKSYITGRIEYIKDCLGKLLEHKSFIGRTDIPEYISEIDTILQKYGDTSVGTFEQQKTMYDSLVEDYKKVLKIEETLSKDVEKIWESALTSTDSYSETGDFGFLAHSLTGGKFDPADMNKLCMTYITQDSITIPYGNFGLIYPMSMQNIIAMSTEDAGSWVISKEEFVKRGFVKSWQYTDAIDDKGNRMFYEMPQNSKLLLPSFMEQQTIANTVAQNGNVLNYDNFVSYNEIILTNLTKDVMPTGVFVSIYPDGKDYSAIIKEAKAYAEELGVPYIEIDVAARRELNRLKTLGVIEPIEYNDVDNGVISELAGKDIMTGTIPETLVGSGPIIDVTPEVMLKKIEDFFTLDMEVKDILNDGVPIDTGQFIDPDGFLLAQQDSLLKVSKTLERKLMSISRNFEFGSEIDAIIREKFKEFEIEIISCNGGYSDLKKIYEKYYTIIRPSFRDLVKNEISGYGGHGLLSGQLDVLLNETVSVDEMLHVIHAYICSNEEYLQSTPIIAQKTTDMGYPVNLYGKENEVAKAIYNAISLDSDVGVTDIVALDDKVLMMVRDLGHALSIEIEIRPTDVYVKYHIPKICNVEKVNALPGVTAVPLDTPITSSTNGYFHSTKESIATDIAEFLNGVPMDSDIVYDLPINYNPKVELIDEKGVLDYFCGPDCKEYYTDTDPNHSLNWSHNFFANDLTRGFFDGDNSYEFAYQKVASKMTDPEMIKKFYKFLDETKLGAYFKTLTCSEWEAVLNYTGGISKSINIPLLEGNKTTEFVKKTIAELDSAISKFELKTDIITYSGQSLKKFASFGIESIEELSQLEGSLMIEKSFVSSSAIVDGAKDSPIIMEIETPAGSNCAYLGIVSSNPSENEVLYGRNTIFQIDSVEYRMNSSGERIAYMHMKVMN